ncbi:MAG: RNA-directed DNA polymerase (Reverse transcriptase) [Parcubacteria group bacterium Licking1014_17]|nr:MAG: RNA-directed DNA polymerase (Reverse transcriptase) [Parcubacteria group bacterium Licking1014_17]
MENLFLAWKEFRRGKKKRRDILEFEFNLEDNLFGLHNQLSAKIYQHSPYESFCITDPKLRHIHKATVRDRILHHAVFRILYPIFDAGFIFDSYSCRLGKGTYRGIRRLKSFCRKLSRNNSRNIFALKCDVKRFFDSIDHEILVGLIKRKIHGENVLWLLGVIISSFKKDIDKGLPLGNVTSQLFANIYLNELDEFVKHHLKLKFYLRYCDDFIILSEDKNYLYELSFLVGNYLNNILQLNLHPQKIIIRKYRQGIDFLGYIVRPYCVNLRTKTRRRILKKVNTDNLQSYLGVLKHCCGYNIQKAMESKLEKKISIC